MRKYFALILTTSLLLPMLVMTGAATTPQQDIVESWRSSPNSPNSDADARPNSGQAQGQTEPFVSHAANFAESIAVRNLPSEIPKRAKSIKLDKAEREVQDHEERRRVVPNYKPSADGALAEPASALSPASSALPPPALIFNGVNDDANREFTFGIRLYPSDANGDVGPHHYVQATNIVFSVFDKRGQPLTPVRPLSSLFAPLGEPCGDRDDGDPIVLYDQLADRWMLSQICAPQPTDEGPYPPYHQVIAISKTGDPTGAYFLYDFILPGEEFNDYPKFGVWSDGYYMTDNQFLNYRNFDGVGVFAFDRQKMLMGDPTASYIYFNLNVASHPEKVAGMLPADLDGLTPPPVGAPCPFAYFTADEYGDVADGMRIFDFHADFANPANSHFRERPESKAVPKGGIPVAAFDPTSAPGRDDVPQPSSTTAYLDAVSDVLMHRLQYRNFGDHESLVVNHTVDSLATGKKRYSIRYYEFRKQPGNSPYTVHEQATHIGPADGTHRWMGSAAMNGAGDLAVAFSVSGASLYPSIRYAARLATDRPRGLHQGEQTIFAGKFAQPVPSSRWGDYSNLSVDPSNDCAFWYTTQVSGSTKPSPYGYPGWVTKISKFSFGNCKPSPRGTLEGIVTNARTGLPIPNAMVKTTNGYARATSGTGNYLMNTVGAGTYTLTASAPGYALAKVPGVIVTDGNTTVQNLALMPVNILAPADAVITSEGISNGVLDPGETVTVNLSLKNIGGPGASTANLVGTLRPTGGVISPGGARTYGAVASGHSVSMPFTFKVDPNQPCGNTLTATLALADGATDYRTITYTFALGLHEVRFAGPPVRVPGHDDRAVNVPIKVSNFVGRVADLDFRIGGTKCTDYAWVPTVGINTRVTGAVTIKLKSPSGTVVTLIDKIGDYGRNFCKTYLDDDATNRPSIQNMKQGYAPFPGVFRPANPLSAFDGEDPNGTWVLSVVDLWFGGYVRDFALRISPGECAPPHRTYSISGQVKIGTTGPAFGNVLMRLDSPTPAGFAPRTTRTDSNGNYSFTDLPVGRNYTLKPAKVNYEFTPVVRRYTNLSANQANQNFAAKLKTYSIAGRVLLGNTWTGISDVVVTISSPTLAGFTPRKVKTNIHGIYTFDNLTAANDYRIEPTPRGYTFIPAMSILSNLSGDQIVTPGTIFRGIPKTTLANEWSMDSIMGELKAQIRRDESRSLTSDLSSGARAVDEECLTVVSDEASGSALMLKQYEKLLRHLARR